VQHQHVLFGTEVHCVITKSHDTRSPFEESSGDGALFATGFYYQRDHVGECVGLGSLVLFDHNAHLFGDQRGINHVDVLIDHAVE